MKKRITLGNVLFLLVLFSPIISFVLACVIGEANIFGVAGIIRYSWIMFLFIPVGILSIFVGMKLKSDKQKYKKNFIVSFICIPLLIIFGSYRFLFNNDVSYDINKILKIEDELKLGIPEEICVASVKLDLYNVSYVKIVDSESKHLFEQKIKNNRLWQNELNFEIKSLLPLDIQHEAEVFEYFIFYNITSDEYNVNPTNGDNEILFIAYDCDMQRLIILDDYKINFNE